MRRYYRYVIRQLCYAPRYVYVYNLSRCAESPSLVLAFIQHQFIEIVIESGNRRIYWSGIRISVIIKEKVAGKIMSEIYAKPNFGRQHRSVRKKEKEIGVYHITYLCRTSRSFMFSCVFPTSVVRCADIVNVFTQGSRRGHINRYRSAFYTSFVCRK